MVPVQKNTKQRVGSTEISRKRAVANRTENTQYSEALASSVSMSNALIESIHGLSVVEKRIIAIAISKLDSVKPQLHAMPILKVSAEDYAALANRDKEGAYFDLEQGSDKLLQRHIVFSHKDRRSGKKVYDAKTKVNWLSKATYVQGLAYVEIVFNEALRTHLTMLREQFTTYKLHQAHALRSVYSFRLLEIFMRWEATGLWRVSIDDFYQMFDVPELYRKNFAHLRKRVIEHAVDELEQKDHWKVDWKPTKAGRKVVQLEFKFQRNPQQDLFD